VRNRYVPNLAAVEGQIKSGRIGVTNHETDIVGHRGTAAAARLPGPTHYAPKLTATGKEFDLADLNGAEKMQMSSCMPGHAQPASNLNPTHAQRCADLRW
jgi:hypothetical protein